MEATCYSCKRVFDIKPKNANRNSGYNKYCSKECFNGFREREKVIWVSCKICGISLRRYKRSISKESRYFCVSCRGTQKIMCSFCKKEVQRNKFELRNYKKWYCSTECRSLGERKSWEDLSRSTLRDHWIRVFGKENLVCNRCKYKKKFNIQIHHKLYLKNGGNNNPDNLEPLCRNCHGEEHYLHGEDNDV